MISAKEYYYTKISPNELGLNYQKMYQSAQYDQSLKDNKHIYSHIPKLSNDFLIEQYIEELISVSSSDFNQRLSNVFIAKSKNLYPQAGAHHAKSTYEGDLIIFNVGLSDLLFQYAILFTQFKKLLSMYKESEKWEDSLTPKLARFCVDLEAISEAHIKWGINKNEIKFEEGYFINPCEDVSINMDMDENFAVTIATFMDKSIIRHEISHHLIGHTGRKSQIPKEIQTTISELLKNENLTEQHFRELEADIYSILLPISKTHYDQKDYTGVLIEVCLGTLLMQTTLAQLKSNIDIGSETHPSWRVRHNVMKKIMKIIYGGSMFNDIFKDVIRFQKLLYMIQGRGLGVTYNIEQIPLNDGDDENILAIAKAVKSSIINA